MPYPTPKHKKCLRQHLESIKEYIVVSSRSHPDGKDVVWNFLQYLGPYLLQECALDFNSRLRNNKGLQDWISIFIDGVFLNVTQTLKERVKLPQISSSLENGFRMFRMRTKNIPFEKTPRLHDFLDELVKEISFLAFGMGDYQALVSLTSYSLTTLGPAILMEVYESEFKSEPFDWLQFLILLWKEAAEDYRQKIVIPHKKEQKRTNGDCEIFAQIRKVVMG